MFKTLTGAELDELTNVLARATHSLERHTLYVWEQGSPEYPGYLALWRETRDLVRDALFPYSD